MNSSAMAEKGYGTFEGIKLLLCKNPLPPIDEAIPAARIEAARSRDILVEPLNHPALGPGYLRITTALPEDNRRFVDTLREMLGHG